MGNGLGSASIPSGQMQLWGYVPDFDAEAAFASAQGNCAILTGVTQVRYHPNREGEVCSYPGAPQVPTWTRAERLPVVPLIANQIAGQWDRDLVAHLLSDSIRRRHHLGCIVACVAAQQHPGVELDYEFLAPRLRDDFSLFVEELAAALHDCGKTLAVAVHAKRSEAGEESGSAAQDWHRIGIAADRIAVMTYDFNPAHPGPIAPLAWTRDVLGFAISCMPATKILQGIPLYGYRWAAGGAPAYLTHQEFIDLAHRYGTPPRRDAIDRHLVLATGTGTPAASTRERSAPEEAPTIEAWLPDIETVAALGEVGRQARIAGYAVWRLGGEEPAVLSALRGKPT